jgi:hypothetical protein
MANKCFLAGLLIWVFTGLPLEAATVSFLVIETGLPEEAEKKALSGLWESGLLDVFFEAGHIVSNAPVMRLGSNPAQELPDEARSEFDQAIEGGADFFILALLDYRADGVKPEQISLRLFRTNPYRKLFEQRYSDTTPRNLKDEYDSLRKLVRELVPHLNDR